MNVVVDTLFLNKVLLLKNFTALFLKNSIALLKSSQFGQGRELHTCIIYYLELRSSILISIFIESTLPRGVVYIQLGEKNGI